MREITLAATFSALLIIGGHWFPWRALLHRDLHRLEAYIMGLLAITGRQRLTALSQMLNNIHQQGRALSDYNHTTATQDINEAIAVIWALQDAICAFKGKSQ